MQELNAQGLTILMVTHEPDIAGFAGRTITLRDGLIRTDRSNEAQDAARALADWRDDDADMEEVLLQAGGAT
jgi:putative ABC transport system ATP-binding protein